MQSRTLAIDPGTTNLGWVVMQGTDIVDAGLDMIWKYQSPIHLSLIRAVIGWYRDHSHIVADCPRIIIEHQYQGKGTTGTFPPLIVMQTLVSLLEFERPGVVELVHPFAVKNHFKIRGTYDDRKRQVVELAGLAHLEGRVHDIADCVLMIEYARSKDEKLAISLLRSTERDRKRKAIRDAARDPSPKRSHSPPPKSCCKCSTLSAKLYVRRGRGHICGNCYGKEYRSKKRI
jgi:hypothetical protein